jgi:CspA family cold shock protein
MTGTVRNYDPILRYGFITGEDGQDYFVHRSDVTGTVLIAGERVTFDPTTTAKGLRAVAVKRIE